MGEAFKPPVRSRVALWVVPCRSARLRHPRRSAACSCLDAGPHSPPSIKASGITLGTADAGSRDRRETDADPPPDPRGPCGPVCTNRTLVGRSASKRIPARTRQFRVQLLGDPNEAACDAFFDLVNVQIASY